MSKQNQRVLVAILSVILTAGVGWAAPKEVRALAIGETAPDFNLPGVDGRNYRLADFADAKVLVVVFTCNHCPTAQAYEERIKKLAEDYKGKGAALVAISPNDPKAVRLDELGYSDLNDSLVEMKFRAREKGFKFPYLYDGETQKVSRAYRPATTPHVFIFDKERRLRYVGRVDDSEKAERVKSHDARNAIEALLSGKAVPIKKTKTIGCSIKWSEKRKSVQEAFERWAKEKVALEGIDTEGVRAIIKNDSSKLRLVNVWASWCPPCVVEFPELVAINRAYRRRNFELITISVDFPANKERAFSFLKSQQASCRNYIYSSENMYQITEALDKKWTGALPYSLVIEPGGKVIYRQEGMINPLEVRKVIVGYLGHTYK